MIRTEQLRELDADGVLASVEAAHAEVVAAEARLFELAVQWVRLHAGDALEEERRRTGRTVLPGMERARPSGADGTPSVAEFAASEFGAVAGLSPAGAASFQADAVNVYYRHPRLWRSVMAGRGRVWQAQQVARMCASADLSADEAGFVDAATTAYITTLPWLRFRTLVEAKIIEADPAGARERARAAALARFVRTGQSNEYGLKTIVARAEAGDVIFFTAMVDRLAHILAEDGDADASTSAVRRRSASWPTRRERWRCSLPVRPATTMATPSMTPRAPSMVTATTTAIQPIRTPGQPIPTPTSRPAPSVTARDSRARGLRSAGVPYAARTRT